MRELLKEAVANLGYKPIGSSDWQAASGLLRFGGFSAALLNQPNSMSDLTTFGQEFKVPLIVMTHDDQAQISDDVDAVLVKPFGLLELTAVLRASLGKFPASTAAAPWPSADLSPFLVPGRESSPKVLASIAQVSSSAQFLTDCPVALGMATAARTQRPERFQQAQGAILMGDLALQGGTPATPGRRFTMALAGQLYPAGKEMVESLSLSGTGFAERQARLKHTLFDQFSSTLKKDKSIPTASVDMLKSALVPGSPAPTWLKRESSIFAACLRISELIVGGAGQKGLPPKDALLQLEREGTPEAIASLREVFYN